MIENRPKLAAALWGQLSQESQEKIKEDQDWENIRRFNDPLALWQGIRRSHATIGAQTPAVNQYYAVQSYQNLKMESWESLAGFMERFQAAIEAIRAAGATVPSNQDQSVAFVFKLDER
jgi:hypothetical protein